MFASGWGGGWWLRLDVVGEHIFLKSWSFFSLEMRGHRCPSAVGPTGLTPRTPAGRFTAQTERGPRPRSPPLFRWTEGDPTNPSVGQLNSSLPHRVWASPIAAPLSNLWHLLLLSALWCGCGTGCGHSTSALRIQLSFFPLC